VSYSLKIEIPGLPSINTASNNHWRVRARHNRKWRHDTILSAKAAGLPPEPLWKAKVTCTRHSAREPDFENLAHSFKPLVDGLVTGGVLVDDNQQVIGQPEYRWEKAAPKKGRVTIEVLSAEKR
jgi:hypothetical protein